MAAPPHFPVRRAAGHAADEVCKRAVRAAHGVQVVAGDRQVLQHAHHLDQHRTVLLREWQPPQRQLQLGEDTAEQPLLFQLLTSAGQHHIQDHAHVSHAGTLTGPEASFTLTLTRFKLGASERLQRLQVGRQGRQPRLVHHSCTTHGLRLACCIVGCLLLLLGLAGLALRHLWLGLLLRCLVFCLPRRDVTQVEHAQHLQHNSHTRDSNQVAVTNNSCSDEPQLQDEVQLMLEHTVLLRVPSQ
jgi:hypothetical protein